MIKRSWAVVAAAVLTLLLYVCGVALTGHLNLDPTHENYGGDSVSR
jgi:hypothetical protein